MPGTTTLPDEELIVEGIGGGGGPTPPPGGGDGGDDGKRRRPGTPSSNRYYTGITLGIVSILMFFMALASAFLVRRGTSGDWIPVHLPAVLWLNTLALIASSFTLERARRSLSRLDLPGFRKLWTVTTGLGALFLIGQLVAWRQLVAQGVFMATNPASSFFYIFTAAHGLHLLGGVGALLFVFFRKFEKTKISLPTAAEITSYYWHFMDGLWVFLLALLYLGK
ncbi:MAG: cytochrome oxidase subunit III [Acidobacteria bacterium]|nr:MAG: cytochrome oxidase subunit III [Acidobacteriota bacterium]